VVGGIATEAAGGETSAVVERGQFGFVGVRGAGVVNRSE
jgi:hypothetical protein